MLNKVFPGLGRDWAEIFGGSQAHIFQNVIAYAMEWETVVARWARDDHALLQPATPCLMVVAIICIAFMKTKIAKRELELCAMACLASCGLGHRE